MANLQYLAVIVTTRILLFQKTSGFYFFAQGKYVLFPFSVNRLPRSNDGARRYNGEENMGHNNPTYDDTASIQENERVYEEIGAVQLRDVGFHNPHFDPGSHYQSLDNTQRGNDSVYMGLDNTQSEV